MKATKRLPFFLGHGTARGGHHFCKVDNSRVRIPNAPPKILINKEKKGCQGHKRELVKRKKLKKNLIRDFHFYYKNRGKFQFFGGEIDLPPLGEYELLDCYMYWEGTGIVMPCKEPEELRKVIHCKKSVNFHIKMWVEGFDDFGMGVDEYLKSFIDPPDWVRTAFIGQLKKKFYEMLQNRKRGS